jgi:DNA polymerase-3 subunit delta
MAGSLRALDYLARADKHPPQPVCVVYGDESFLKREVLRALRGAVLGSGDGDFSLASFEGRSAELRDVLAEVETVSMFGEGRRLVVVEGADDFVSRHRAALEDYVARPSPSGVLALEVKSWPTNTRLHRALAQDGLLIECKAPTAGMLIRWLTGWAKARHNLRLPSTAAQALVELVGEELGLLDQELAKLAAAAGPGGAVDAETVGKMVGTWRTKTTWEMLDAALDGNPREALKQLDRLLLAGEHPIGLLAQISATLRRLAAATRLVLDAEAAGRPISLGQALQEAGIRSFVLKKSEAQLRRLGRHRGQQLYRWLLETDLNLKGGSSLEPRLVLEQLIVRLAEPSLRQVAGSG